MDHLQSHIGGFQKGAAEMSKADLLKLFGEVPGKTVQGTSGKIVILRIQTHLRNKQGKIIWVYTCRGHQKISTDPCLLTRGRTFKDLGDIFSVFRVVEIVDDGRMTARLRAAWHDAKI